MAIVTVVLSLAAVIFMLSKPDSLVPPAATEDVDKVQGFAERNGVNCSSHSPTLWQFIMGGRPKLSPHYICRLRTSSSTLRPPLEQARDLKAALGNEVERYFANSDLIVGIRYGVSGSTLACYFPKREWKWLWCLDDGDKGCYFANCSKGIVR